MDHPQGIFKNLPLASVQAIQTRAIAMMMEGKTIMSTSSSGKSSSKQFTISVDRVLAECNYAISLITKSGLIRRTVPDFSRHHYYVYSENL